MAEYRKPRNDEEFESNFAQIHPRMNETEAYYESSRCLFCYDAPCVHACPTGIDIPLFIRQINTGNITGASRTIYDANYFGHACGKVCPTEVLCEGACVYNHQDVKPIEIGRLQSYATASTLENDINVFGETKSNGVAVAVVGAGPAGISCACALRGYGYAVTIYEARDQPSGLTVHGVAPYKITDEDALDEVNYLQKHFDFEIHYNSRLDASGIAALSDSHAAVFLAVGLGPTTHVDIPGSDLDGCVGAVEFIEDLRRKKSGLPTANTVIVIGGGNTAMDAASESARLGAENVILAYRRSKKSMRAYEFEYDLAKGAGVQGMFNVQPIEIVGDAKVTGVRFARTIEKDGSLTIDDNSRFVVDCDEVIFATGQSKQKHLVEKITGLEVDRSGRIVVDEHGQTTNPTYFAGGDAVNGGKEVVNAVAEGKNAAAGIHDYLTRTNE